MARTKTVERLPLSERVYRQLRSDILQGKLPENAELNQVALAERFGVSIIPVREAIRHLQADGLVLIRPFQPAIVRGLSAEEIEEMLRLREELEAFGLRRHIASITHQQLDALERFNHRLEQAESQSDWRKHDWAFHARLAGSDTVTAELVEGLRRRLHGIMRADVRVARHRDAIVEHGRIVEALREGDVDRAESELRAHIRKTADAVLESMLTDA